MSFSPNEGLFQFTTTENRVGFVDKQGREVVPFQYDNFSEESDEGSVCKEGLCVVAKNGQYGFVDTTGRLAIMLQYEYANDFSDGLAAVKKNNKWAKDLLNSYFSKEIYKCPVTTCKDVQPISYQGNANQSHSEMLLQTHRIAVIKKGR